MLQVSAGTGNRLKAEQIRKYNQSCAVIENGERANSATYYLT